MHKTMTALALAAGLGVLATGASADEIKLVFSTGQPDNGVSAMVLHPWADRINEQGKGVVQIEVHDGFALTNPANAVDRVLGGVVQIAYGLQSAAAGKFPRSAVVALPFLGDDSEKASVAFWRLYANGLLKAEYTDVVPLMLMRFNPSTLHFREALASPDAIAGRKVAITSKPMSDATVALGMVPQSIQPQDQYEALQRGTVDGSVIGWNAFTPFKIGEVTTYHIDAPMSGGPAMVFMARATYEALPEAARKIIDANSGEAFSRQGGVWSDKDAARVRDAAKAKGDTVVELSAEEAAAWQAKTAPVIDAWAKSAPDGEAVLAAFKDELAKVQQ